MFNKFAANERLQWQPPCALESKRIILSDSMLRNTESYNFAPDVAVMIASGMSIADCANVLIVGTTSAG